MIETIEALHQKIGKAKTLGSVVRTMKALAASNIRQYEEAVRALADYYHTIELGLSASLRGIDGHYSRFIKPEKKNTADYCCCVWLGSGSCRLV